MQFDLQEFRHSKFGAVGPMVFHWSCVLLLRSRIATRRIFIAVRLSSLNTAAHNRTHPIALSYSGDDLRFIGVRFLFSSIYIEQKRGYGCTLLRATRTQIAMNRQKETGKTGAATGNLNFPASYCDQSQTRPAEAALDSRQITNRIAKPRRFARLNAIRRKWSSGVSVE